MTTAIEALRAFAAQRPGLDFADYGDVAAYRAEIRSIGKDLSHARALLNACELAGLSDDAMVEASKHAFSGRLTLAQVKPGQWEIDYCTGQYWPTEYRRAVCAVAASALWSYWRDSTSPVEGAETWQPGIVDMSAPIRRTAQRNLGRGIAQRWFQ